MSDRHELDTEHVPRKAASSPTGGLRVHVFGPGPVATHSLPTAGTLTIGRSSSVEIHVDDASVSRKHALLHIGQRLHVEDLESANGTWVRHAKLAPGKKVEVHPGDVIDVGSVMLVIHSSHGLSSAASRVVAAQVQLQADGVMENLQRVVERVASSDISVLLLGETGVGKEVCAQTIHRLSPRSARPFLGLNCAALSPTLLESELFGHERGAFTGALTAKAGLFETADGGTVFLDELGELPLAVQVKLLRVLETRQLMRVGGTQARSFDVRFLSATHRDLEADIAAGTFRQDLYYRLAAFPLVIPPLRERRDEIASLAQTFITQACERDRRAQIPTLSREALEGLQRQSWPGNIRELRNAVERAVLLCGDGPITLEHLPATRAAGSVDRTPTPQEPLKPAALPSRSELRKKLTEVELQELVDALAECGGNQTRAAERLGISRRTLVNRMSQHKLPRPRR